MQDRRILLVNKSDGEFVDLGLPSGLKWAKGNLKKSGNTCVIGDETDYGDFWSWANVGLTNDTGWMDSEGGIMTQNMYNSTTGKSYSTNIFSTDATHDVAYKYLGAPWRLPTAAELDELIHNTDYEWTTIDSVEGLKFMKKTDHSIYVFFPASGQCRESGLSWRYKNNQYQSIYGLYWSSTLNYYDSGKQAYLMVFWWQYPNSVNISSVSSNSYSRYAGLSIRPVHN